jgi:hypothetical protein
MPQDDSKYTKPALRESIKKRVMAGSKGGKPGQWSARKAQLTASEYKKAGGGYKGGEGKSQKSLKKWGKEDWQTKEEYNKNKAKKSVTAAKIAKKR